MNSQPVPFEIDDSDVENAGLLASESKASFLHRYKNMHSRTCFTLYFHPTCAHT